MKRSILLLLLLLSSTFVLFSQTDKRLAQGLLSVEKIQAVPLPAQDTKALLADELAKRTSGRAPKYAVNIPVDFTPQTYGHWEATKGDGMVYRMKIKSPGAEAINLGFTRYNMPRGGKLFLYSSDYKEVFGPFTPADNEEHEQLWTPNITGDEIIVEIQIPKSEQANLDIELGFVNHAFQKFSSAALLSGSCNLDVICGAADGWGIVDPHRDIIQSVAVISTGGGTFCTGFLISNANQDCTPLFMTANHCGINGGNAASLVTYWNFFNSTCRQPNSTASGQNGNGTLADFNTGSIFRATNAASDFCIVELDDPVSETANAYFAGYDASGAQPTSAIGVHHPSTDEKRISFEDDPTEFTTYGGGSTTNYTHVRVVDWDTGTTEGGSSGSPLFDQDERIIGQLHGGGAACGNNSSDWYGSLAVSWEGGGSSTTRLRDWLDPNNTGTLVNNGYYAGNCDFSVLADPVSQDVCPPTNAVYNLTVSGAFTSNVTLSTSNLPAGLNASFSSNNVAPGSSITLTISNTSNAAAGSYDFDINGTDGTNTSTNSLAINILPSAGTAPTYTSPNNGATGESPFPTLSWNGVAGVDYNIEIATNASFSNIIETATVTGSSYNSTNTGDPLTTYFWRISADSPCGNGPFGAGWSFTTINVQCVSATASNLGLAIGPNNGTTTNSVLNIPDDAIITDVNVIGIDLTHTWINDLTIYLTSPTGQQVQLMDRICGNEDNLLMSFDDQATSGFTDIPCPPTDGQSYQPFAPLSTFNGLNAQGDWTLSITDNANQDGGTLIAWNLQMCFEETVIPDLAATAAVTENNECFGDAEGVIEVTAAGGTAPYTYSIDGSNFQNDAFFDELAAGTYTVTIMDAANMSFTINNLTVSHPADIIASVSVNQDDVTISQNGGTSPFVYSLDGTNFQSANTFNNLANGNYTVFVEDFNGCTVQENFTISVNTVTLFAEITQEILCFNDNNGIITATAGGGQAPYTYSITGGGSQNNGIFGNLSNGTYQITVEDNDGFSQTTTSITINNPSPLSITSNVNDNDLTAIGSGGTGALTYSIDGNNYQSNPQFNNLSNGNYTLFVQDENGCIETTTVVIAVNNLAVSAQATDILCNGDNDGIITAAATGGETPYMYSIDGTNFQASNTFAGLSAGNYQITIQDADGFTQITSTVAIFEPSTITASANTNNDEITVNANGGTPPLQYSIDGTNYQASNIFSGLNNGSYTISVQDENGCIETTTAIVAVNSIVVSAQATDILCNGDNDGIITAAATGGETPYMYSIDGINFQANNTFAGLSAGNYQITAQDADGFIQITSTVSVSEPSAITAAANTNNDEITVNANGGTPPFEYSIDGTNYQASNIFSGLANNSYTVFVQDANDCVVTTTAIVAVNGLIVSAQSSDILCNGQNNGTITATAAGGEEPYMYSIDGMNFQASATFAGLSTGNYEITIQDADGFTQITNTVTIAEPSIITVSAVVNNNAITIDAEGGTADLQYSIDGENFQNSNTFNGLTNGTYTISVQDANGCLETTTATVLVNSLVISIEATNISCHDENNGIITAFVNGGQEPYMYSIDGENFQSSPIFDNLEAGAYTITGQDAMGLFVTSSTITIVNPEALTVSVIVEDDNISAMGSGGVLDYMYSMDGINYQENSVFSNLTNGTYTIFIIDNNDCTSTTEATVLVNTISGSAAISSQISCFGDSNGAISVSTTSGNAPFQYSIDGGMNYQMDNYFGGLSAGEYSFTILDSDGFTFTTNAILLSQPTELQANSSVTDNTITITAEGGINPYFYSINGGEFTMDNVFEGLINGTYDILIQDINGCEVFLTEIINVNTMSISLTIENSISCFNEADGVIIVNVMGGTAPFMYSLDGENFQESNVFMDLTAGAYSFTITDAQGALSETTAVMLTNPEQLFANANTIENSVTLTGTGGTGDYLYSLDGEIFQSSDTFSDLVNGDYIGYIQDANGCIAETQFTISSFALFAVAEVVQNIDCFSDKTGIIEINASGGAAPYTYSIDGLAYVLDNVFVELTAGVYNCYVQDANGTVYEAETVTILESELLVLNAQSIASTIIASAEGGVAPYEFSIDGENFQTSGTFNELPDGEYSVIVMDALACTQTLNLVIDVVGTEDIMNTLNFNIYPNPNTGTFSIELENEIRGELTISLYNVVGQRLFEANATKGNDLLTYRISNLELPAGTYEVLVKGETYFGMKKLVVMR